MSNANVHEGTSPAATPLLVSINEAARLLSIGRSTVYELIWNGDLTPVRIGRCVRLRRTDLEDYVAEHRADKN